MASRQKFYTVWVGKKPGVYTTWADCEQQVKGIVGAKYKSYPSLEIAREAFTKTPLWDHKLRSALIDQKINLPTHYLCVDAACSGVPGPVEWRVVKMPERKIILKKGPYHYGSNNIGEFLALVDAIRYRQDHTLDLAIYSDSITALAWVRNKKCKTTIDVAKNNKQLAALIFEAESFLTSSGKFNELLKWETNNWGEIPADYGRK